MINTAWGAAGILLLAGAAGSQPDTFPEIKGRDLTGQPVTTHDFRGKPWLITLGFDRAHAKGIEQWSTAFRQAFPDEARADLFAIVALDGQLNVFRSTINRSMSKDKPERVKKRIMTVYAADSICRQLKIKDRTQIQVYLLDRSGRIVHRETGGFEDAAFTRVREAAAALVAEPSR